MHQSVTTLSDTHGGSLSGFPEEDLRSAGRNNVGYFPARLGQCFERGRYCIVRKLGWGQYSSVWLARDKDNDRFVALKILTCEATKAKADNLSDELGLLQTISTSKPAHRGYRHTLLYYDTFIFKGPHGEHQCIVTEVLGFSLNYVRNMREDRSVLPSTVKHIVKQILMGLEYLHDECKIIHGDIKHDNVLFRPSNLTEVITSELTKSPSVTYDCGTEATPTVVPIVSQALPATTDAIIPETSLEGVLADLGHSHRREHHFQEIIQPAALRAPEVILGYRWDTPADIWNFGCIVFELLAGFWLFEPYSTKDWDYQEDHLVRMTQALGTSFDVAFLNKCENKAKFFNEDGTFAHFTEHESPRWPLAKLLKEFSLLGSQVELDGAENFIRRCLQFTPEDRATATALLEDPWLQL
ncbi:hypothetical protein M422DRAFT_73895 [Sphaerobolus stellatus SS14]|nr:hypothetical protein M422DRAFT_73895 [Sphaerobolus stellatus SS14]